MDYKMYSFSNFGIASNLCQKKKWRKSKEKDLEKRMGERRKKAH